MHAQQMAMKLNSAGGGTAPGGMEMRRNAAAGPNLAAATAAAAAAASLQKSTHAEAAPDDDDEEEEQVLGKIAQMIKACNVENMKAAGKMFVDGSSLRPGLAGLCFTQMLVLGALILSGGLPDADAYVAISSKADLEGLVMFGTGDAAYIKAGEAYRVVSPLFIHGGVLHLTGVLLLQVWFGEHLEFSMGTKKFLVLWFVSGVGGVMMGAAYNKKLAVIGACSSCAGLMGATLTYTLIHWNEWSKPYKHVVQVVGLVVLDVGISLFPEGRIIAGSTMGHAISGLMGMGLGFAFHPTFDKHHSGAVMGGKLLAFAFTGLFYMSVLIFLFFINEVKVPVTKVEATALDEVAIEGADASLETLRRLLRSSPP
jgi:membrane associated rhomboid family serine protease